MDSNEFFKKHQSLIEECLDKTVESFISSKKKELVKISDLLDYFKAANKSGKMTRGLAVIVGYALAGGKDFEKAVIPAVAFEIFQSSILIHDDIIDKSERRRGMDSVYHRYNIIGRNKFHHKGEEAKHYGISQAICMGDAGLTFAIEVLAQSDFPAAITLKAVMNFINTITTTGLGEMLDVELPYYKKNEDCTEDDINAVNINKTAQYTCTGPLQLGAILANADDKLMSNIKLFGDNLGTAFQIKDDLLIFSEIKRREKDEKDFFADLKERKKTYLLRYALESKLINESEKATLEGLCGKTLKYDEKVTAISILEKSGARALCNKKIQGHVERAKSLIDDICIDDFSKSLLLKYVEKVV